MIIGVISDTHGLLRPQAIEALRGSEQIIHAGDVGNPAILDRLSAIAPVTAVCGNVDVGGWARKLPQTNVLEIEGITIYALHILDQLDLNPEAAGFSAVIYGHTHEPHIETKNGVLYFNPGSAGPRRFDLPVSVGRLSLQDGRITADIVELQDESPHPGRKKRD